MKKQTAQPSEEFTRFEKLAKGLIAVSKKELEHGKSQYSRTKNSRPKRLAK
jgi:hypothetical protein